MAIVSGGRAAGGLVTSPTAVSGGRAAGTAPTSAPVYNPLARTSSTTPTSNALTWTGSATQPNNSIPWTGSATQPNTTIPWTGSATKAAPSVNPWPVDLSGLANKTPVVAGTGSTSNLTGNAIPWTGTATQPAPTAAPSTGPTTPNPSGPAGYNPLAFKPLDNPSDQEDLNATMTGNPGSFYSSFQNVLNHDQIAQGNRAAQEAVNKYNGEMKNYLLNGGANNKYGMVAPEKPDLTQFYKPAMSSTSQYVSPTDPNSITGGDWRQAGGGSTLTLPEGVNSNSNVAPWHPPSTWAQNPNNAYNPNNPNQGFTSNTTSSTGSQGRLGTQSPAQQYLSNVLGSQNNTQQSQQYQGMNPQINELLQYLNQYLNSTGNMGLSQSHDIFGQYNPFGQFGGGLGNMGSANLGTYGLSGMNNNSFYFPQFV